MQREAATALGLIGDRSALPILKERLKVTQDVEDAMAEATKRLEKP